MAVLSFRDLVAWQRAMDLVVEVYRLTRQFPREEIYGLTAQLRRATISIPSNIAEGQGRGVGQDFARFLRVALGSLQEVQTQLMIAERLEYVGQEELRVVMALADEVARISKGLLASVTTN